MKQHIANQLNKIIQENAGQPDGTYIAANRYIAKLVEDQIAPAYQKLSDAHEARLKTKSVIAYENPIAMWHINAVPSTLYNDSESHDDDRCAIAASNHLADVSEHLAIRRTFASDNSNEANAEFEAGVLSQAIYLIESTDQLLVDMVEMIENAA